MERRESEPTPNPRICTECGGLLGVTDDPSVADIAALLAQAYTQEGVVVWLAGRKRSMNEERPIDLMRTKEGRQRVYAEAIRLADGVFS